MMNKEHWPRAKTILKKALDLPTEEIAPFLDRACGDDQSLRELVESLLGAKNVDLATLEKNLGQLRDEAGEPAQPMTIGPYRIVRELGRGGMGTVYLAERELEEIRRQVAVKVLKKGLDTDEIVKRFRVERQILAHLNHPNIARLNDAGSTEDGLPYYAMEYVEGLPVRVYCEQHRLDLSARLSLFRKVCAAVAYAHQNLIIHRDLKSSNILVDDSGEPKLLDFGIAKLLRARPDWSQPLTATDQLWITPDYASPEQVLGQRITTASDVYSLGVLLFEILTGGLPYRLQGLSPARLEDVICRQEPRKPSAYEPAPPETTDKSVGEARRPRADATIAKFRARLKGDLDNIVLMALRKEPERRYASVQLFSQDIEHFLRGFPVTARKETFGYLASKFIRRHRLATATAVAGLAGIIAFVVALLFQVQETRRERDRAQQALTWAQRERIQVERVSDFLIDLFKQADPLLEQENPLTVREVIDRAAKELDGDQNLALETKGSLLSTLGQVYSNLGSHDLALRQLETALELQKQDLGEAHPDVAKTLLSLGHHYINVANYPEAEAALNQALAINASPEGDPLERAKIYVALGATHVGLREWAEAEILFKEGLDFLESSPEYSHYLAWALSALGTVYIDQRRLDLGEQTLLRAVQLSRESLGENHAIYAEAVGNLAALIFYQGRYAEAEAYMRETLKITERKYGPEHSLVANQLGNIGATCQKQGKYDEAESMYLKSHNIFKKSLGDHHHMVGRVLGALSALFEEQQRFIEAENYARQTLALMEKAHGEDNPTLISYIEFLIKVLEKNERFDEAKTLKSRAAVLREKQKAKKVPE